LVGTTADFWRFGLRHPLPLNHLPGENRETAGRIGEVGLETPAPQKKMTCPWSRAFNKSSGRAGPPGKKRMLFFLAQIFF
jgi:hypothetical protein